MLYILTAENDLFRIMLVEDEEDFSSLVKIHLERINDKLQISTFTNASQAIEALQNQQFNVIVSDYHMPDIDGLTFLAKIRKQNISTPFILFTGVDQEELENRAFDAGATYFIKKHVGKNIKETIAELNRFLNFILRQQRKASKNGIIKITPTTSMEFRIEDHFDLIFQNVEFGLYVLNLSGEVIYANKKAAQDLGYSSVEKLLANKSNKDIFAILDVYNPKYFDFLTKKFSFKSGEELFSDELINVPLSDKVMNEKWFLKKITPIFSDDFVLRFVAISTYDMSNIIKNEYESRHELQNSLLLNNTLDLLFHAIDEQDFMESFCKLLVEKSDYILVWIGSAEVHHNQKIVLPIASYGFESDYLDTIKITWDSSPTGSGPVGTAIKTGTLSVFNDIVHDKDFTPWRDLALRRGYHSVISIPIKLSSDSPIQGSLNLYSTKVNAFNEKEQTFLSNLSRLLSAGLQILKTGTDPLVDEVFNEFPIPLIDANINEFFNLSDKIRQHYSGDLRTYIEKNPESLKNIVNSIKIVKVNKKTLELFQTDYKNLINNFSDYLSTHSFETFKEIIIALQEGKKEIIRKITIKNSNQAKLEVMIKIVLESKPKSMFNHLLIAIIQI